MQAALKSRGRRPREPPARGSRGSGRLLVQRARPQLGEERAGGLQILLPTTKSHSRSCSTRSPPAPAARVRTRRKGGKEQPRPNLDIISPAHDKRRKRFGAGGLLIPLQGGHCRKHNVLQSVKRLAMESSSPTPTARLVRVEIVDGRPFKGG